MNDAELPTSAASTIAAKILLIEDNDIMSFTIRMMLESLGCTVDHTSTARQALDRIEGGKTADLVLSDIILPGEMSGIAFARLMRDRDPHLPVLLTTGFTAAAEEARDAGFSVLLKPYPLEALADALDKIRRAA
jgi:CheY-like chemotaxis protein